MEENKILILGIGNILFSDEGVGIRVVERLLSCYDFPENVTIIDGGVLGLSLMCYMTEVNQLIVVDAVRNGGPPGTLYRLEGDDVPRRFLAKNSLHQIDFLEALTACDVIEELPETVIIGIEPEDIDTLGLELTPTVQSKVDGLLEGVFKELDRLGVKYRKKEEVQDVSCCSCQNYQN
jgi:hydrogenase maturation protease